MEELNRLDIAGVLAADHFPFIVLLDDVRSMHNVGSVFRTADAFNIESIYLCGYTPKPPHRDIHKTALGATETVVWQYEPDITVAIKTLKNKGYEILAIEQVHGSILLQDADFSREKKAAFIFGNEVSGVSDAALVLCDKCIEIPQWGSKHSLNIAVTAGVVLWEAVKRE